MTDESMLGKEGVLNALDTPRTTNEITELLRARVREAWAEETGQEIAWGEDHEQLGARLLASAWAMDRGYYLNHDQVYRCLVNLEKEGKVTRVFVYSHSLLWARVNP